MQGVKIMEPSVPTALPAVYTRQQALRLFQSVNSTEDKLYREVKNNKIRTYLPPGKKRGATFNKQDVDRVLSSLSASYTPEKSNGVPAEAMDRGVAQQPTIITTWLRKEQVPHFYVFDVRMQGMENALEPKVLLHWLEKNPYLCRVLQKEDDPTQIYGALTILPLQEETLLRLLKREISKSDLTAKDILVYKSERNFIGYIQFLSIDTKYRHELQNLILSMFGAWCRFFPNSQIRKLYARAHTEEASMLLSRFYFAPRYDLSTRPDQTDVYELDIRRPNRSPLVQKVQRSMNVIAPPSPVEKLSADLIASIQTFLPEDHHADPDSPTFERATFEDLAATFEIDQELYPPGGYNPLEARQQRYRVNPDGFYVLRHHNEVVAHAYFFPMEKTALQSMLDGTGRVPLSAIQRWEIGKPLYVHIVMVSVKKGSDSKHRYGTRLLAGIVGVFEELGKQGVEIARVTARSQTSDGIRTCQGLGMLQEPMPGGESRFFRFALDMRTSSMRLARAYQAAYAEYQLRQMQQFSNDDL